MKNCEGCPSYLTEPDQVRKAIGKLVGAPVCGRYGHVLGSEALDEETNTAIRQKFAMECTSYGEPLPPKPVSVLLRVAGSDPDIVDAGPSNDDISNCRSCAHYIAAPDVRETFGWAMPMCRATGKLIAKPDTEWKTCGYAKQSVSQWDKKVWLDDVELLPYYKMGFRVATATAIKALTSHIDLLTKPSEYESDKPVSAEEAARGIRAWREVTDPTGGDGKTYLPIFDPLHFDEEERAKIPQFGDDEHPELYLDYNGLFFSFAIESIELKETVLLQGAPGLGKTEFARALAYAMQLPFERITFRQRMDGDALLGNPQYDPEKGTYFQPGRLPLCYERPCVLVLDEPNVVEDDDVLHVLRPMTDNSSQLVVEGVSGDGQRGSWRFTKNDDCYLLLAQNPSWDTKNIGTRELASADANRLSVLTVEDPPEAIEREIITARCRLDGYEIAADVLTAIVAIGKDIRALEAEGAFPDHWGTRQQIKVARKIPHYGFERAYKIAALDLYAPEVGEFVLQSIASHVTTAADKAARAQMR